NSLWRPGARAFFKDQRAKQVGDVLTVVVSITNEKASLADETRRTRDNTKETVSVPNFFGIPLPHGVQGANQSPALDAESGSDFHGKGTVDRSETINLRLAAVVVQVLPNGNLAVAGRQEVRVNNDLREIK